MANLVDNVASNKAKKSPPNPMMAILFFFIVTSIYCVISIFLTDTSQRLIFKVCYVLFIISGEYFINLNLTESMCGIRQWSTTFFITIIPWMFIFIVMHLFIHMFPGWLSPFSNTFGYLVAKLMGLPEFMKEILVESSEGNEASRALESVKSDNTLLINELYPESGTIAKVQEKKDGKFVFLKDGKTPQMINDVDARGVPIYERPKFKKAWDKLVEGKIIKKQYASGKSENSDSMINRLYFFVQMKFTIAEYIWNLLTGFLVTSVSYNYIINAGCAKSPKEMKERYDQYEADEDQKRSDKKEANNNNPEYVQS